MKKVLKGIEPPLLETYRERNPRKKWSQCKSNTARRNEIQEQLRTDLGGLCAYCEIDLLKTSNNEEQADFQVEHFHPKSDESTAHNWHIDWNNMLACCLGGKQKEVVDADNRHTNPNLRCGALKDDNNWDDVILNPLDIPASPRLFDFQRTNGQMLVNDAHCQAADIDLGKAQTTIDQLNLDGSTLRHLRSEHLKLVNIQLQAHVRKGLSVEDARDKLASALLRKDSHGNWPKFFTALRCYLGQSAETHLTSIGYIG